MYNIVIKGVGDTRTLHRNLPVLETIFGYKRLKGGARALGDYEGA